MAHQIITRLVALSIAALLFTPLVATWRAWRIGCNPLFDSGVEVVFIVGITALALCFLALAIVG